MLRHPRCVAPGCLSSQALAGGSFEEMRQKPSLLPGKLLSRLRHVVMATDNDASGHDTIPMSHNMAIKIMASLHAVHCGPCKRCTVLRQQYYIR